MADITTDGVVEGMRMKPIAEYQGKCYRFTSYR